MRQGGAARGMPTSSHRRASEGRPQAPPLLFRVTRLDVLFSVLFSSVVLVGLPAAGSPKARDLATLGLTLPGHEEDWSPVSGGSHSDLSRNA